MVAYLHIYFNTAIRY